MAKRPYEDRYRSTGYGRDRDYAHDRGYMDRATDEVRSWFGDEDAERRRRGDEEYDRAWRREHEWRERHGMEGHRDEPSYRAPSAYDRTRGYGVSGPGSRRDWEERTRWYDRERGGHPEWSHRSDWDRSHRDEERDRGWQTSERSWASHDPYSRGSDWSHREDSSRSWSTPWERDDRERDLSSERTSRRSGWSSPTDDRDRAPSSAFGYRYAGDTSSWSNRGRGPKNYQRSDTRIYEDICDRLSRGDVDAEHIDVAVSNGEVTLSGTVNDRWDKRRAEDVADDIAGVREVHNHIRVQRDERSSGLGYSETSHSSQPGSVLGVDASRSDRDRTTGGDRPTGGMSAGGTKRSV